MNVSRKICVLGDFGVGKTSLIRRFVHGIFDSQYQATLGVNCYTQDMEVLHPKTQFMVSARGVIWDIEGGAQKISMTDTYLVGCQGALFVADLSRPNTLDILYEYDQRVQRVAPGCPLVLALNKCDMADSLDDASATFEAMQEVADELSAKVIHTSASSGDKVPEAFAEIVAAGLT